MVNPVIPVEDLRRVVIHIAVILLLVPFVAYHYDIVSEILDLSVSIVISILGVMGLYFTAKWLKKSAKKKSINSSKKKTKSQSGRYQITKKK